MKSTALMTGVDLLSRSKTCTPSTVNSCTSSMIRGGATFGALPQAATIPAITITSEAFAKNLLINFICIGVRTNSQAFYCLDLLWSLGRLKPIERDGFGGLFTHRNTQHIILSLNIPVYIVTNIFSIDVAQIIQVLLVIIQAR